MARRDEPFTFGDTSTQPTRARRWPLLVAVLALPLGLATYWYFQPAARPAVLADWLGKVLPVAPSATTVFYRWQDEKGEWVVSDRPPPGGVAYEELRYRDDTNVLPSANGGDDD